MSTRSARSVQRSASEIGRGHGRSRRWMAVLLGSLATALLACGGEPASTGSARAETPPAAAPVSEPPAAPEQDQPVRSEPLLPRFEAEQLSGGRGGTDLLRDQRAVVFAFASNEALAEEAAGLVKGLQQSAADANIALLGVTRDKDREQAKAFVEKHELRFPVLIDADLSITQKLRVRPGAPALALVDQKGYMLGAVSIDDPESTAYLDQQIRQLLRLPDESAQNLLFGVEREAPDFQVTGIDGGTFKLSSLQDQAAVVIFFLHTCPHCHEALRFLSRLQQELGPDKFAVVPISVRNNVPGVQDMAKQFGLQLAFYTDPGRAAQNLYPGTGSVPHMFVLNRKRGIIAQYEGMDARIEALISMQVRKELGAQNPILLAKDTYSGEATCTVCHTEQHSTWALTTHAHAFDTLVKRGQENNAECLGCHTVGFNEPGGYNQQLRQSHLEGVQCENCHGRGGPHQSPEFAKAGFEAACLKCHTPQHSLRFQFAERLPIISHAANLAKVASMSLEERRKLLEERGKRERTLFDEGKFVGSAACQGCHAKEHGIWASSPHAKAFTTLRTQQKDQQAECQGCHSTGFQKPGGFPTGGASFEGVGCESCHGPGEKHVQPDAPKKGTILALADKCDSCVILQICGSCHDEQNDPRFDFEVEKKIDLIRHSTPPKSKGASAE
jgi:peroxiredoxin